MVQSRLRNRPGSSLLKLLHHTQFEILTKPLYYPSTHTIIPDISIANSDNLYQDVAAPQAFAGLYSPFPYNKDWKPVAAELFWSIQ